MSLSDLLAFGFLPLFVGMWCLVCMMLSAIGGWKRLANRYPAPDRPTGMRHDMASARVGMVSYNNCLTLYTGDEGIYFSVWFVFRLHHKPFLIPWSELKGPQVKKVLWSKYVRLDVGTPKMATITLSEKVFVSFKNVAEQLTEADR